MPLSRSLLACLCLGAAPLLAAAVPPGTVVLRIADVRLPTSAHREAGLPVVVELSGPGLAGEEVTVLLDVYAPGKREPVQTLRQKVRLGVQDSPLARARFQVDGSSAGLRPGIWRVAARVPGHGRETVPVREHASPPADVPVGGGPVRVLLLADLPGREIRLLRELLSRQIFEGRVEVGVRLTSPGGLEQPPADEPAQPGEHLLARFPEVGGGGKPPDRPRPWWQELGGYDVVLACDPDWERLTDAQLHALGRRADAGGGLIVCAGPLNTVALARPVGFRDRYRPIQDLLPVVLRDARLDDREGSLKDRWRLRFDAKAVGPETAFLDLEGAGAEGPEKPPSLECWERFFTDQPRPPRGAALRRGFSACYPAEAKAGAVVLAALEGPPSRPGAAAGRPYLAVSSHRPWRVVWLAGGETWRLHRYSPAYHERFWTGLVRYAAGGNRPRPAGRLAVCAGRRFRPGGAVLLEARALDRDGGVVPASTRPILTLWPPAREGDRPRTLPLSPRRDGEPWGGWFEARVPVQVPGEYRYAVTMPATGETVHGKFTVEKGEP